MNIEKRAQAFAMAYCATAKHNGEVVDQDHLKAAVLDTMTAAILDDRAERVELKAAIEAERKAIALMLITEAERLSELAKAFRFSPGTAAGYTIAAEICEKLERAVRG